MKDQEDDPDPGEPSQPAGEVPGNIPLAVTQYKG